MNDASRIGPLRRGRPYKSERHAALDEHTAQLHPDPRAPWRMPAPSREPIKTVEQEWPLLWVAYAAGVCAGVGGSVIWRLLTSIAS